MGYYVQTEDVSFIIKKKNLKKAYKALCKLNERDELKTGGSWTPEGPTKFWFAWMDPNDPETCKTTEDILTQLGFDVDVNEKGDIINVFYDGKAGAEQHFFEALATFVEPDSFIDWRGESGEYYKWVFKNKKMDTKNGMIFYN